MKNLVLILLLFGMSMAQGQKTQEEQAIRTLISDYAQARETKNTVLLKQLLTKDIDQLVSSGIWRKGHDASLNGMMQSSTKNRGTRTLLVENIRFLHASVALVDCRYTIARTDGSQRKMWSSFIVKYKDNSWKITAIRNMLPATSPK